MSFRRKKITVRLEPYKPIVDPPDKLCRTCLRMRPGWSWGHTAHPSVCYDCTNRFQVAETSPTYYFEGGDADRKMLHAINAVVKRLRYNDKNPDPGSDRRATLKTIQSDVVHRQFD